MTMDLLVWFCGTNELSLNQKSFVFCFLLNLSVVQIQTLNDLSVHKFNPKGLNVQKSGYLFVYKLVKIESKFG